jgi:hypothetical protein
MPIIDLKPSTKLTLQIHCDKCKDMILTAYHESYNIQINVWSLDKCVVYCSKCSIVMMEGIVCDDYDRKEG